MKIAKAVVAAVMTVLGTVATALEDGTLTNAELVTIVGSTLAVLLAVYRVPNRTPDSE